MTLSRAYTLRCDPDVALLQSGVIKFFRKVGDAINTYSPLPEGARVLSGPDSLSDFKMILT